jgi:hypothetical protein
VADSAMRLIACAGLLATGLLMGCAGTGIAIADTGDSAVGGTEGASVTSKIDGGSDSASDAPKPDPPTSTVGSGRDDVGVKSADEENKDEDKKKDDFPAGSNKFKGSFTVPIQRIPRKDELPASVACLK